MTRYVVIRLSCNDLYAEMFDTREEALESIESTDEKCVLVAAKDAAGVHVEYFT